MPKPPSPPIDPERVLSGPYDYGRPKVTAQQLYALCCRTEHGIRGVARLIGTVPKTIHRHLRYDPSKGKPAPQMSYRVVQALRKQLQPD